MSRNYSKADLAPVVFAVVKRIILRGGLEAATIRTIAGEANTSTGALRNRWPDKSVLIQATCWAVQRDLGRAPLRRAASRPGRTDAGGRQQSRHEQLVDYLAASLPFDEQAREDTTIWLAYRVRARWADDDVRRAVMELDALWLDECRRAVTYLGVSDVDRETLRLHLLMEGLRARICDPVEFTFADALATLDDHLRRIAPEEAPRPGESTLSPLVNER